MSTALLVRVDPNVARRLRESAGSDTAVEEVHRVEKVLTRLDKDPVGVEVVVLGSALQNPVRITQRLRALHQDLAVLILSEPTYTEALTRAIQFSPFMNSSVVCHSTEDVTHVADAFKHMLTRTRKQRTYEAMLQAVQPQLPTPTTSLQSTRLYLDTLLDLAPIGIVLVDREQRILEWNACAEGIFELSERQAIGVPVTDLFPAPARGPLKELVAGHKAEPRGIPLTLERTTQQGEVQFLDVTAAPVAGRHAASGTLILFQDSTRRIRAEEEARQLMQQHAVAAALAEQADELRQLNRELEKRNRDLQEFAYVASHDLQEPLRKISAFSELLRTEYGTELDEMGRLYLQRMQDSALRMTELIRGLLSYSRVTTHGRPFENVDLDRIVGEVLSDLELVVKEQRGRVVVEPLPSLRGDPAQMRQLFQNLIGNALKFHKPDVTPVVRIHAVHEQGAPAPPLESSPVYRIFVEDNGIGFDEKYLDRIFQPFQRLHGPNMFPGTGMGLAICRRIVERHGGTITARSRPGVGSTFVVTLPVTHTAEQSRSQE